MEREREIKGLTGRLFTSRYWWIPLVVMFLSMSGGGGGGGE